MNAARKVRVPRVVAIQKGNIGLARKNPRIKVGKKNPTGIKGG